MSEWTAAQSFRRSALIDKHRAHGLTPAEAAEFRGLNPPERGAHAMDDEFSVETPRHPQPARRGSPRPQRR